VSVWVSENLFYKPVSNKIENKLKIVQEVYYSLLVKKQFIL